MAAASSLLRPALLSAPLSSVAPAHTSTLSETHGLSASAAHSRKLFCAPSGDRRTRSPTCNQVKFRTHSPHAMLDSDKASTAEGSDLPPPGCSRVKVELGRPLGIAFEETKIGTIVVGEVISGGNAANSGLVEVGDQLIATSAVIYSDTDNYQGVTVRKGMQIVRLNVRGERFETVMAGIGTHPAYIKVDVSQAKVAWETVHMLDSIRQEESPWHPRERVPEIEPL